MRRQKETCEMLFSDTSIPIIVDERLRQIDNGPQCTGMNFDIGKRDYLNFIDKPFPQRESFNDFARRVRKFLDDTAEKYGTTRFSPLDAAESRHLRPHLPWHGLGGSHYQQRKTLAGHLRIDDGRLVTSYNAVADQGEDHA
jgi:Histidine phosphatase superfamily (branch 1)